MLCLSLKSNLSLWSEGPRNRKYRVNAARVSLALAFVAIKTKLFNSSEVSRTWLRRSHNHICWLHARCMGHAPYDSTSSNRRLGESDQSTSVGSPDSPQSSTLPWLSPYRMVVKDENERRISIHSLKESNRIEQIQSSVILDVNEVACTSFRQLIGRWTALTRRILADTRLLRCGTSGSIHPGVGLILFACASRIGSRCTSCTWNKNVQFGLPRISSKACRFKLDTGRISNRWWRLGGTHARQTSADAARAWRSSCRWSMMISTSSCGSLFEAFIKIISVSE